MRKGFMKFNQLCFSSLLLGIPFLFSGCASYKAEPLKDFTENNTSYSEDPIEKDLVL